MIKIIDFITYLPLICTVAIDSVIENIIVIKNMI